MSADGGALRAFLVQCLGCEKRRPLNAVICAKERGLYLGGRD